MSGFSHGFRRDTPKSFMTIEEGKQAILDACKKGASYQGFDALLTAVNDVRGGKRLSRQDAHAALSSLRGDGLISPTNSNIHSL
ncbi:MAG TPA: hypothetical protein VFH06_04955 [Candidatus Saccharimonadales bacterium]|nr:hypothetical protein [Candidatus Saccharimonadales bacterium]